MRHRWCTFVLVVGTLASAQPLTGAEGRGLARLWPFGSQSDSESARAAQVQRPQAQRPQASWPRLLPGFPAGPKSDGGTERASWFDPQVVPATWHRVTDRTRRLGAETRQAWGTASSLLTPPWSANTAASPSRDAPRQATPSLWQRMLGAAEPNPGPRTVGDWLKQERLDP